MLTSLPQEQWHTLLRDAHPGYISWEQYQDNQRQLRQNEQVRNADHRSPARAGLALLQGLALCGLCGDPMRVAYHAQSGQLIPDYECYRRTQQRGEPPCQVIYGAGIDTAIGKLLVEAVSPLALEVALSVQQEIQTRVEEADRLRRTQVERARYEAQLAQCRYLQVDPGNRLVAGVGDRLEHEVARTGRRPTRVCTTDGLRRHRSATARTYPGWPVTSRGSGRIPTHPIRERKRMARLLLEDVTLTKKKDITLGVRFKGGATTVLTIPRPPRVKLRGRPGNRPPAGPPHHR